MQRREQREKAVVQAIKLYRLEQPQCGGKKLHAALKWELLESGYQIGRDWFFAVLRKYKLFAEKRPRSFPVTTYSSHGYATQPNLIKDFTETSPEQVVVADLTYLRLKDSFAYLFLITDKYSRKILGHYVSEDMKALGANKALEEARRNVSSSKGIIHHSDRGSQYCCHEFINELHSHGMRSSMTDENHCAQNALAERVNGILKQEFYLDCRFPSLPSLRKAVRGAIDIYNNKRLHWSLNLKTPEDIHSGHVGQIAA